MEPACETCTYFQTTIEFRVRPPDSLRQRSTLPALRSPGFEQQASGQPPYGDARSAD